MIALVLGLLVSIAAVGLFLSNQKTYRATESLARIQESVRVAFELMARDMREAAGNPCGNNLPVANVLNGAAGAGVPWWMNWNRGVFGYDGGGLQGSAAGTDAVEILSSGDVVVTVTRQDQVPGMPGVFTLNTGNLGLRAKDIILVCDHSQLSIVQVSSAGEGGRTVAFNQGGTGPGNCTSGLGLPVACTPSGNGKFYRANSLIAPLEAAQWFVADNGRGGRSLYRLRREGSTPRDQVRDEITEGIRDMQITYLVAGADGYVNARPGLDWSAVIAVRLVLSLEGTGRVGVAGTRLVRSFSHTVTLRNRNT
ncbi:MAG TPA: PilW family protein [Lysobacter sp.]